MPRQKNPAAVALGKLGGKKEARLAPQLSPPSSAARVRVLLLMDVLRS